MFSRLMNLPATFWMVGIEKEKKHNEVVKEIFVYKDREV